MAYAGGINAYATARSTSDLYRCINSYNCGAVSGAGGTSAILARNGYDSNTNKYRCVNTCYLTGCGGSSGLSEATLKTYANTLNNGQTPTVWVNDTTNINSGYPILVWQIPANR